MLVCSGICIGIVQMRVAPKSAAIRQCQIEPLKEAVRGLKPKMGQGDVMCP